MASITFYRCYMRIAEHLEAIEKLAIDRASPAEIRGHVLFIRDQMEAYEADAALHAEREKKIQNLEAGNLALRADNARRESEDAKAFYGWGGTIGAD